MDATNTPGAGNSGDAETAAAVERIFHRWDEALGAKDEEASLALYHEDCTLESPLVCYLLGTDDGIIRGRGALRPFVRRVFASNPPQRRRFRLGYLSDGSRLTWEYPRQALDGEQMDLVEVMEISDGLIKNHRVYWGWLSVSMLTSGEHPR